MEKIIIGQSMRPYGRPRNGRGQVGPATFEREQDRYLVPKCPVEEKFRRMNTRPTTTKMVRGRDGMINALFNVLHATHLTPVRPVYTAEGSGSFVYE
jgi:hypothetical protein